MVGRPSGVHELLALINGSEYGLAAYVNGELGEALLLAERVGAGMVGVIRGLVSDPSAPFGGVKQSSLGREGARAGLEEYLETPIASAWRGGEIGATSSPHAGGRRPVFGITPANCAVLQELSNAGVVPST